MGAAYAAGLAEYGDLGLVAHLEGNFYPPLPKQVQIDIIAAIKAWNRGELEDLEEVTQLCQLRTVDALLNYFGAFLEV